MVFLREDRRSWTVVLKTAICVSAMAAGAVSATNQAPEVLCHDLGGFKFASIDLADGVGSLDGPDQTEMWTVTCPDGATPCPQPTGSLYTPYHSGRHGVHYVLETVEEDVIDQCFYHLDVGPPGLQAELEWEWDLGPGEDTVDLDIHLHKPADVMPWGGNTGTPEDCAYSNCRADDFNPVLPDPSAPSWFDGGVSPPDPVNWYLSPVFEENTCYHMPGSQGGSTWQSIGLGCHNPRLSLDNIICDPVITDPQNSEYCHPETVNIDFMPLGQWTRIGVHYYSSHSQTYDVHPKVKLFCHRKLVVELGDAVTSGLGYGIEVTFTPADETTLFWLVADVVFLEHPQTGAPTCIVRPLFSNSQRAPLLTTVTAVQSSVGPPYAAVPEPLFWDGFESGETSAWH